MASNHQPPEMNPEREQVWPVPHDGIRLTLLLDGQGGGAPIDWRGVERWSRGEGTLWLQLDPRHGAIDWLSHTINPDSVHLTAAIVLGYAVLRFIEAWGLWRVRSWASWLGCTGAAVYLPFDVYALFKHPGWLSVSVLVVNLVVVWVLARDLFKRHH